MPDQATAPASGLALAAKGFRPLFFAAGALGTILVPLWLLVWTGDLTVAGPLPGVIWHAHEMIHGFTMAVVAGFLLTAASNWSGRTTLVGNPLLALTALWVTARVLLWFVPGWSGALVDLLFLPGVAFGVGRALVASGSRRNYPMLVVLAGLWLTNLAVYVGVATDDLGLATQANRTAVLMVSLLILMIGGRVVPMFTRNATGESTVRNVAVLDRLVLGATALTVITQPWAPDSVVAGLSVVAGVAALARMATWGTQHTRRKPMLWVLHLGHAMVALGLVLHGMSAYGMVATSTALHTLTVGGIGLMTLGMMSRVSLGHTGRPIVASGVVTLGFVAMVVALVARVGVVWGWPQHMIPALWTAAVGWSVGFAVFCVAIGPKLWQRRPDGREG